MSSMTRTVDAVVIGGGFYGAVIALYLVKQRQIKRVLLVEKEDRLLRRASYHNQARVHNGYHYPRSFTTAFRSRVNLPKFIQDWPSVVKQDFIKLYAIARRNSKVTGKQFERFCQEIGARLDPADLRLVQLFEPRLIESVFQVQEYAFNADRLAAWAQTEILAAGVEVKLCSRVISVSRSSRLPLSVSILDSQGSLQSVSSRYVFNCTYSGLNQLKGEFPGTQTTLRHEITEMALIQVPSVLQDVGITVMDGPFFSIMPFPARGLYTLSHVRYTPHLSWEDRIGADPYQSLHEYSKESRFDRMIRDVSRYLPVIREAVQVDSLFEVKTVLKKNEGDDGRPILFERHTELPGCYSVLGGKIDNIYDVVSLLDREIFEGSSIHSVELTQAK
ncbi:MAG: FAD-dependent oxidoreductase [Bdellovibrionia bacterium]